MSVCARAVVLQSFVRSRDVEYNVVVFSQRVTVFLSQPLCLKANFQPFLKARDANRTPQHLGIQGYAGTQVRHIPNAHYTNAAWTKYLSCLAVRHAGNPLEAIRIIGIVIMNTLIVVVIEVVPNQPMASVGVGCLTPLTSCRQLHVRWISHPVVVVY